MKIKHTHIVQTTTDDRGVEIHFRVEGSDSSDEPTIVRVTPHKNYIHLNLSHAEFNEFGGNHKDVTFTKVP